MISLVEFIIINFAFTLIFFFIHKVVINREPFSSGFVVLISITLRYIAFYIFYKIFNSNINFSKQYFLIITFSFLAMDVALATKMLNKK